MNNYSVTFSILGYYFKIITHNFWLHRKQVEHVKKFCISKVDESLWQTNDLAVEDNTEKEIEQRNYLITTIEYFENESFFNKLRKNFETHDTTIVQSFEGIFHLKYIDNGKEYFCQLGNEWILIKNSDKSYIVVGSGINDTIKYPFRIVREIVVRKQEENGKLFMHATACCYKGKGIALLGNKKSGKTTFFTKILEKHHDDVISNDRVFFYKGVDGFKMDYFPIPVVYRHGTVSNSKSLNKYIIQEDNYCKSKEFWGGDEGLPVPLTDLPKIFRGVSLRESSTIDVLIFTRFHLDWEAQFICKRLDILETCTLLMDTCFTPIDYESKRKEWVYFKNVKEKVIIINAENIIKDLAENVKAYRLDFGRNVNIDEVLKSVLS